MKQYTVTFQCGMSDTTFNSAMDAFKALNDPTVKCLEQVQTSTKSYVLVEATEAGLEVFKTTFASFAYKIGPCTWYTTQKA